MPATITVNFLTVVHKSSNGVNMAFPDVCKTPAPPAPPIPIPYPNIAMSKDTASGSSSVKMDGNPIMLKSSNYSMSTGDEAGSLFGVVSNKIKGKAYPKMFSFDVKVEGENVFRQFDIMLQNGGSPTNTPPAPTLQPPAVTLPAKVDPDKFKVVKLSWDQTEAYCGDEVKLTVETENLNGRSVLISAVREAPTFKSVGLIQAPISGEKANPAWLARRGPYQPTVKLKAKVAALGGPKESSNQLEVKGVADVKEIFSEQRTAHAMEWFSIPGVGGMWVTKANYGWDTTYERKIEKGIVYITKKILFVPRIHVSTKAKPPIITNKMRNRWKQEIESIWDRKLKLHRKECKRGRKCDCSVCGGCMFPIRVVCEWGAGHGKSVAFFGGSPSANDWGKRDLWWYSHTWWEGVGGAPATVRAHEFGHLIGMYDEYKEGAVSPAARFSTSFSDRRVVDPSSIMNAGSRVYPRHYEEFQKWFETKASAIGKTELLPY